MLHGCRGITGEENYPGTFSGTLFPFYRLISIYETELTFNLFVNIKYYFFESLKLLAKLW